MKITYWSDYACPYCYIGEKRFKKAIEELGIKDAEMEIKSFELNPNASDNIEYKTDERFALKYGLSLEAARTQIEKISNLGKAEGLDFNYATTLYTNTFNAHRLTKLVKSKGIKENNDKVVELLFDAYFAKSLKLSDKDVLVDIAKQVGIGKEEVENMLLTDNYADEVRLDEKEAKEKGVKGVPFFVIDNKYAIPGAYLKNDIKQILLKIYEENRLENINNGISCGLVGCKIK